jgi:FkbM family methyltransferase
MSLLSNAERHLIDYLLDQKLKPPQLHLIDVGVSGGVYPLWRRWGDSLSGLGIDVIIDEIERLRGQETNPGMRYVAARVASSESNPANTRTDYALHRSQAYLATVVLQRETPSSEANFRNLWKETVFSSNAPIEANYSNIKDPKTDPFFGYYQRRFGRMEEPRITDHVATLDELVGETGVSMHPDVLKIDTDGYELSVLQGATQTLSKCVVVEVEIQFQGLLARNANVFCNIDALLREQGFTLCKLLPAYYSRSALPRPFLYGIPAQNNEGRIAWADALYIRDLADANYEQRFGFSATADQRRTLALILDVYGLEDSAAELLLATPGLFDGYRDEEALNFLAGKLYGPTMSYKNLVEGFCRDPINFPQRS